MRDVFDFVSDCAGVDFSPLGPAAQSPAIPEGTLDCARPMDDAFLEEPRR